MRVQEVIRYQELTEVPLSAAAVTGLINLRGRIVTALDLRRRLQLPRRPDGRLPMNVVLHSDDGAVSLLVDEIGDVVEVDDDAVGRPPDTVQGIARELVHSVCECQGQLLLVLDADRALAVTSAPAQAAVT